MTPAFWKDRKVFITGHTGFKGAWLVMLLRHLGARVTGYALEPPTQPSLFQWAHLDELVTDWREDILDVPRLRAALQRAAPEIVIHMAAQSLVRPSYRDPLETYVTNVIGTANLLQAVSSGSPHLMPRVVLIVTTDKVYAHGAFARPFCEDDPLGGQADPYSTSKTCAEMVAAQFAERLAGQLAVLTARAGNVLGGGDFAADRILPDAVRAFARGDSLALRYPQAVRPWQHVLDPLRGYLTLCERAFDVGSDFSGAWNFGPDAAHEWSVEKLVQTFARQWPGARWHWQEGTHPPETSILRLDSTKARERLNWTCRLPLPEAVRLTAEFYQRMTTGADVRALMQSQIENELARCESS